MNIDPRLLAGADQDMADANRVLNDLIKAWKDFRPDLDPVERVSLFAGGAMDEGVPQQALAILLSIAIKRLANPFEHRGERLAGHE